MGAMSFGTSVYMYYTPILGPSKSSIFIFSVPFLAIALAAINIFGGFLVTQRMLAMYKKKKKDKK